MTITKALDVIVIISPILTYLILFPFMKDEVPIHAGIVGNINNFGNVLILAVPAVLMSLIILAMVSTKDIKNKIVKSIFIAYFYLILYPWFIAAIYYGDGTFNSDNIYIGFFNQITSTFVNQFLTIIMIVFFLMGFFADKVKQNALLGIRNKWTMSSQETWEQVHNDSKIYFILCGLFNFIIFAVPVLGNNIKLTISIASIIIVLITVTLKSYQISKRCKEPTNIS